MDTWHELRVSRTAKSGILQVDSQKPVEGITEVLLGILVSFVLPECFSEKGVAFSTASIIITGPANNIYVNENALLCYTKAPDWLMLKQRHLVASYAHRHDMFCNSCTPVTFNVYVLWK